PPGSGAGADHRCGRQPERRCLPWSVRLHHPAARLPALCPHSWPAGRSVMFSGSYDPADVTFLLKPVQLATTPVAEKERLIQSGQRHYSEMIGAEALPSPRYLQLFHDALKREKARFARDLLRLAGEIAARRSGEITLVSRARAGTPVGVLLTRTLRERLARRATHYSVSIIRDRGIDEVALRFILARHDPASVVFVDGWTGKG